MFFSQPMFSQVYSGDFIHWALIDNLKGIKMNRKTAAFSFLGICVVLAILLLIRAIPPLVSGSIFAITLVLLGVFSRGFRK